MLEDIKALLGLEDETQDRLLNVIIKNIIARLLLRIQKANADIMTVPDDLMHIVTEVAVARYNQLSSEGTTSHSIAGTSYTWLDDLLSPYLDEIDDWLSISGYKSGGIRFI